MIEIRAFITGWNDRCRRPKTPDEIVKKANRQRTSVAVH
jgi:hypothetical protein